MFLFKFMSGFQDIITRTKPVSNFNTLLAGKADLAWHAQKLKLCQRGAVCGADLRLEVCALFTFGRRLQLQSFALLSQQGRPPPRLWGLLLRLWVSHCFVVKTQGEFGPKCTFLWPHGFSFTVGQKVFQAQQMPQSELVSCHLFSSVSLWPVCRLLQGQGKKLTYRTLVALLEVCRCGSLSLVPWVPLSAGSAHELKFHVLPLFSFSEKYQELNFKSRNTCGPNNSRVPS